MPEIMPENRDVIDVYAKVRSQHIMGMSGPVDINILAIKAVMDLQGIENQKRVFEKVYKLYNHIMSRIRDQQEAESRAT